MVVNNISLLRFMRDVSNTRPVSVQSNKELCDPGALGIKENIGLSLLLAFVYGWANIKKSDILQQNVDLLYNPIKV